MKMPTVVLILAGTIGSSLPAKADLFPFEVFLSEDNLTTGFTAPGKISVALRPIKIKPGTIVLCEPLSKPANVPPLCGGTAISDFVTFTNTDATQIVFANLATLHSDIANET